VPGWEKFFVPSTKPGKHWGTNPTFELDPKKAQVWISEQIGTRMKPFLELESDTLAAGIVDSMPPDFESGSQAEAWLLEKGVTGKAAKIALKTYKRRRLNGDPTDELDLGAR
jgi:hypothetical protein